MSTQTEGPSELLKLQWEFAELVPLLLLRMKGAGQKYNLGDTLRSIEEAKRKGKANSIHTLKLAIDINLFRDDGEYISSSFPHKQFGEWWKQQHPKARWGGDFPKADGNHYSFEYKGVR